MPRQVINVFEHKQIEFNDVVQVEEALIEEVDGRSKMRKIENKFQGLMLKNP